MDTDLSHEALKLFGEIHERLNKIEQHLGINSQPENTQSTPESEHE